VTQQLGLPFGLVRNTDPMTSVRAASRAQGFRASHEARIYSAISDAGTCGATFKEIAAVTGMDRVAVARRLAKMSESGLIYRKVLSEEGEYEQRNGCAMWFRR
jgi:CRP-like cAMP-binding protein